ncbi:MAG: hypothetical protein CFH17_00082 [Alphaproteobacteria bacterium MarineAlpha5_Bin7]|nr:MAG: hypothetical protein CFH17_00082 [Alphaproteobacteria bacterium MarineAlpha5_Bin7]
MSILRFNILTFIFLAAYSTAANSQTITSWSELWNGAQTAEQILDPDDNVNTHCDFQTGEYAEEMSNLNSFKNIEVQINNKKKWIRNGLAILKTKSNHMHKSFFTLNNDNKFEIKSNFYSFKWNKDKFKSGLVWDSFTDYMNIDQKYKSKFKAKVIVNYDFGTCIYDARVRQTGDMMDHISYQRDNLIQSLSIQLKEGSIANIVNFKLFRKEARNALTEILITLLLKELDYIAPRTRLVSVNVNGYERDMLFQENPVKEMLEKNLRREGPLFEGDETVQYNTSSYTDGYEWKNQEFIFSLSNTRIENKKWAMQNNSALRMALKAQSKLQLVYMDWRSQTSDSVSITPRSIKIDHLTQGNSFATNDLEAYNILILLGLGDTHQFTANRKFFWNSLKGAFEPVYYDSMIAHNKIPEIKPFKFSLDQDYFYSKKFIKIVENLNFKLNNIKIDQIIDEAMLLCRGYYCVKKDMVKFFNDIKKNLEMYQSMLEYDKKNLKVIDESLDEKQTIRNYKNRLFHYLPNSNVYFIDINSININKNLEESPQIKAIKCNIPSCEEVLVTREFVLDMMKADTYGRYEQHTYGGVYNNQNKTTKTFIEELKIEITHSFGSSVIYDSNSKTIKFYQDNKDDWFLLSDVNLSNINFEMISSFDNNKKLISRFNEYGLTGCINFFQVNFINVNMKIVGGGCEDSLNIIKSTGAINELNVSEALSDAVDLDFSNLKIKLLDVSRAQNDCLDVSGGTYHLHYGLLKGCGDKGISVGESSHFTGKNIFVNNSNIGISSKDSSITNIDYLSAKDMNLCLEAYQKKQEFYGSKLFVNKSDCLPSSQGKENNFFKDDNSLISINGIKHNTNMYN